MADRCKHTEKQWTVITGAGRTAKKNGGGVTWTPPPRETG